MASMAPGVAATGRKKHLLKIVVLGDAGTGKTSLMNRYVNHRFTTCYKTTIGADFLTREIMVGDTLATMQIWDTAGAERFCSLGSAFYRGADACMLVYDVHNKATFDHLEYWHSEFTNMGDIKNPSTFPFVVVGNKCDIDKPFQVDKKIVQEWCDKNVSRPTYYETSAKEGTNVDQAFLKLATMGVDLIPVYEPPVPYLPDLKTPEQAENEWCCTIL